MKWHNAGEETVPPLPYLFAFGKIFVSFCHPTSCFIATQCLQNIPLPHTFHRYSRGKGLAGRGGDRTVSGCEKEAAAGIVILCVSFFCICMAGWVGLHNPDVILPGFGLVLTLIQPTGSSAAVSQLLSRSLSPMHVCLCVFCAGSLLICYTHAPPHPCLLSGDMNFGSNEL